MTFIRQIRRKSNVADGVILPPAFECRSHTSLSFHLIPSGADEDKFIACYLCHPWVGENGDLIGVVTLGPQDFLDAGWTVPVVDNEFVEDDPYYSLHHSHFCRDGDTNALDELCKVAKVRTLFDKKGYAAYAQANCPCDD